MIGNAFRQIVRYNKYDKFELKVGSAGPKEGRKEIWCHVDVDVSASMKGE